MSSASNRRKSSGSGEESGGAYWMDTYGDLVTLLLTFFVLLFSMSSIDAAKWEALVGSFTGISPIGVDPISPEVAIADPIPQFGPPSQMDDPSDPSDPSTSNPQDSDDREELESLREMYAIMSGFIEQGGIDAEIDLVEDEYMVRMIFNDQVFFETASAVIRQDAFPILDAIIEMFQAVEHLYSMMIVEGHADIRPINTQQYPSNWHLSAYRAVNVLGYLKEAGQLDSNRLAAVGYGEEQPIAPNNSPENMARNRRVEFVAEAGNRGRAARTLES